MDSGLTRFINRGVRFSTLKTSATYVGLKTAADPTTSFYLNLPTVLPGSTQALAVDASGNMSYIAIGGGGSVTSVAVAAPADFTVLGSPVTTAGTISLSRNSQSANLFLASPNGAAGVPTYRAMVAGDIPVHLSSKISDFDTQVRLSRPDQLATVGANFNLGGFKAVGLADPTNAQDAVTKAYADALLNGTLNTSYARVIATGNLSLNAPGAAIDGVTLANGDVILLAGQSTASQNGLYVFNGAAATLTRATNADTSGEVRTGLFVFVGEGATGGSSGFTLVTPSPITLGTTNLTFSQTSGTFSRKTK